MTRDLESEPFVDKGRPLKEKKAVAWFLVVSWVQGHKIGDFEEEELSKEEWYEELSLMHVSFSQNYISLNSESEGAQMFNGHTKNTLQNLLQSCDAEETRIWIQNLWEGGAQWTQQGFGWIM